MDSKSKVEYEFLDFDGRDLDDNEREKLRTYLQFNPSSDILKLPWDVGDNDCNDNIVSDQETELNKPWVAYSHDEDMMKYTLPQATPSPMFPVVITYPSEWANCVYQVPNEMSMQYTTGIQPVAPYSPYINPAANENQDIHSGRENNRRSGVRGRGGLKRGGDNYNRSSQNNDIPFYSVPCMSDQYQSVYCPNSFPDHTMMSQQHPATGQPVFVNPQQIYSQQTATMHIQSHTNYPQYHHQHHSSPSSSQGNMKYNRQSQSSIQSNGGEIMKNTLKSYDKRGQNNNTNSKSSRQNLNDDKSSKQTIRTTVIVNNSNMEPFVNNADSNAAMKKNNNSNNNNNNNNNNNSNSIINNSKVVAPFNVKIDYNFVATRNETYGGSEKNDGPCVNIKSSIEIEQNGDNDSDSKKEKTVSTSSHIQTVLKTQSSSKTLEENNDPDADVEPDDHEDDEQEVVENDCDTQQSNIPVDDSPKIKTWANVLKDATVTTTKPMAFINPTVAVDSSEVLSNDAFLYTTRESQNAEQKVVQNNLTTTEALEKNIQTQQKTSLLNTTAQQHDFDDPLTYRMGEFFLNFQMDKQTVSLLPRGLTNRSNYCYINSILQALLACPPFYNLLKALPFSENLRRSCSRTPLIDNMTKFVHEFTPLSEAARMPRKDRGSRRGNEDTLTDVHCGIPFEPSYVYTVLKNTSSAGVFSIEGRQEDAEEFLSCLLNGISDEMLEVMKLVNSDKNSNNNTNMNLNSEQQQEEEWQIMGPKNKGSITRCTDFGRTPLSDIFRGQLRSRVHRAGEQPTDYVQPFFTLQLDIEKAESVRSALEILVGKDQLEGMTCSKTKQQIEAWKQVTLEELPVILILHLKWFDYKLDGCSKILKNVEFPVDLKIDPKFLSPNASKKFLAKQKQYKLFAVTYHDGKEATKGHYVTDAFHVGYGGWVRYDDSSLKGISENNVLNPQLPRVPYLLYYRRCDTIGNNQSNVVKSR